MGEGVIFIQYCTKDDEDTEGEEDAEEEFLCPGELGGYEEGEGDAEHHYVGGDVKDGVGY
jgi:hypothetical protein